MKYYFKIYVLFISSCLYTYKIQANQTSLLPKTTSQIVYSKHWFDRLPLLNYQNPLLIHDLFIISFLPNKNLPLWVAYQMSPSLVWGHIKAKRKYTTDPLYPGLSFKDYRGASKCGYDRGHLAPLGSFKNSTFIYQAQYLSNIVPQKRNLNQGPWRQLEESVRKFVKKGHQVRILTGPIYGQSGQKQAPCWKAAQGKIEEIPIAYWKVIAYKHKKYIQYCAVWMPQTVSNKNKHFTNYEVQLNHIEKHTKLKLFFNNKKRIQKKSHCKFLL